MLSVVALVVVKMGLVVGRKVDEKEWLCNGYKKNAGERWSDKMTEGGKRRQGFSRLKGSAPSLGFKFMRMRITKRALCLCKRD
jgi:hypothetical protein